MTLRCFAEPFDFDALDRRPFKFRHTLSDHPALSLGNLERVLPELPAANVFYSKGLRDLAVDFDRAHIDHPNGMSLRETIESIRTSSSYIAVSKPETHASFRDLFHDLTQDIGLCMRRRRSGSAPLEPSMWLFIASPGAVTPFHCDRYSNFLMQFRGSKEVAVFDPWNDAVISPEDCESWVANTSRPPPWRAQADQHANKFEFAPGEAIHIPFVAGHYVKNGPEDVSISLSCFFHTEETVRWTRALHVNHRMRRRLARLGLTPTSVRRLPRLDAWKAEVVYPMTQGARTLVRLARRSKVGAEKAGRYA
ncbi:MAG TPA: cupin-like domain-containing protein [Polyangiaceae bacterium]|jgi:hypothetical protein